MSKRFTAGATQIVRVSRDKNHGTLKVRFPWSSRIARVLGWPDVPEGTGEWQPDEQELQATSVELSPAEPELARFSVTLDTLTIGDFTVVRKKAKAGVNAIKADKRITSVSATIKFMDPAGCAKIEGYMLSAGKADMLVTYVPAPVQEELPGTASEPQDDAQQSFAEEAREAVEGVTDDEVTIAFAEAEQTVKRGRGRPKKAVQP